MIHLFDKVYITYAETSVGPGAPDKFPDEYIRIIDKNLSGFSHVNYDDLQLYKGKTLKEVLDNFETEDHFVSLLKDKKRVILYCDEVAMKEFLIKWWKGMFPDLDVESCYFLYKNYADSELIRLSQKDRSFLHYTLNSNPIDFRKFFPLYWQTSITEFAKIFNKAKAFNLDHGIKNLASVEILIADYIAQGEISWALEEKINHLFKKQLIYEIFSAKRITEQYLFHFLKEDGVDIFKGVSVTEKIQDLDNYKPIIDSKIVNTIESLKYIEDAYDLKQICTDMLAFDKRVCIRNNFPEERSEGDNPCMAYYVKENKYPSVEELLDLEIEGKSIFNLISQLAMGNKLNPYLVPAVSTAEEELAKKYRVF